MISSVVISNLLYLIGAIVLAIIGGLIVVRHHRKPTSVEATVSTFSRGLRALAPESASSNKAAAVRRLPDPAVGPEITDRVRVVDAERRAAHLIRPGGEKTEAEAG